MGISVITPLPFGGGDGGGASWGWGRGRYLSAPCVFCSSVFSVRKRTFLRLAGEFYLSQSIQSSRSFLRTFRVHKEVVHLLLMLIFNLLRPPPWVLFSVQIHSEELKALEGVGAGLLGNSGKLHLYGVVALFGVEALRNHC